MTEEQLDLAEDAIRRLMPSVIEHACSAPLSQALADLRDRLKEVGRTGTAARIEGVIGHLREATERLLPKPSGHPK